MDPAIQIAKQLGISSKQVAAATELLDADNTIPFIARYRKERTAGLDEEQLRSISNQLRSFRSLDQRRSTVLRSLQSRDMLTPQLEAALHAADTLTQIEDLYQPHKPKRKTRASVARENGLAPLADLILNQAAIKGDLSSIAHRYLSSNVQTVDEAWLGARDIVAETISDHSAIRASIRERAVRRATLVSKVKPNAHDPQQVYRLYYEFTIRVDRIRPHQVLAINRGEKEKMVTVGILIPERDWRTPVAEHFNIKPESPFAEHLQLAIDDAAHRLLLPAIGRNIRRLLTEAAEEHATTVFAQNLRGLLLQPPITDHTILAIDPGFRSGSKLAVVDQNGKVLECTTIYPHPPQQERGKSIACLENLITRYEVSLLAIGNGTASRETELLAADMLSANHNIRYLIVNEAGASVYSASTLARSELPDLDVSLRGAVSIARRVIDPLAEFVKIDPQSLGVGMYQHDIDQRRLTEVLTGVVESVVNQVGADANTASAALLSYVSGIGPKLAELIVAYRDEHGSYENRTSLLNVPGFGSKTFQQAAGFIRINSGKNPLDSSAIHPESYLAAQ
ncbi:MAG: helix-hairpin-helix domain-containing protein, partial [Anaerolineales bacterium]|nr:helix-hairpin-helix domain-containing protein [Anaerolineales bacterium]